MRRLNVKGQDRPSISKSDITQNTMPYPNSIRLDPIRLPRPTILREPPIFDIDHNTNTFSSSRGVIRAQVTPSHGPFTFPEHLRTRRLDDININPVNDESLTRATSSVSAIDVNQVVTNQMPLEAPEERNDQVHVLQITPQIIPRESPVAQPTPETLVLPTQMPSTTVKNVISVKSNQHTMKARALCSNPHLGYQRIVFLLAKYPTLVMTMVTLWNVEGHGKETPKSTTEKCAFYSALTTAAIVLVSQIILHTNHHYSFKKARIMSYLYHLVMMVAFCAAVTCVVFAVINFNDFRKMTNTSKWQYVKNTTSYYSNEERAIHQAILAGGGGMTVLLALATFIYGGIGLNLMKSRLADEYEKEARLNAYENQAFQY
ncbi:hypothetical protein Angca_000547 [Angiostrongylus cantonensis]|nr:hypothetical protein Angca_000547 [Angiostrongylus cantonensis]